MDFEHLADVVQQFKNSYRHLTDDEAFTLWFLRAHLLNSDEEAIHAITGKQNDKSIDALFIDHKSELVVIIQAKFHLSFGKQESRPDVIAHANLASVLQGKEALDAYKEKLNARAREKLEEAMPYINKKGYGLDLYFVTTGSCSDRLQTEAKRLVRTSAIKANFFTIDHRRVKPILKDYLLGEAPGVPMLKLRILNGGKVRHEGNLRRYDPASKIESWVFSMSSVDVGNLYKGAGTRLFAKNIRGYLGKDNPINDGMVATIKHDPSSFWYYNNGVTIICDEAQEVSIKGERYLEVDRPQVINGQQTTITLSHRSSEDADLLVKVIKVPRYERSAQEFDELVDAIVRATNWQSVIKPSDLVSNHSIQVEIERSLRSLRYNYLRKRQAKQETRAIFGSSGFIVTKEEFAQASAATKFDQSLLKKGKEILFSPDYYRSVFSTSDARYYLPRYWLMKHVRTRARSNKKWQHSSWLITSWLWKLLGSKMSRKDLEQAFRHASEDRAAVLRPLFGAIDGAYRVAMSLFQAEKGSGKDEKNIASFFKQDKLLLRYERMLNGQRMIDRKKIHNDLKKFLLKLPKFERSR